MISELIARATAHLAKDLPFVIYRKPGDEKIVSIFQQDARLHCVKDFTEKGFVFSPFDSQNPSILIPFEDICTVPYHPQKRAMPKTFNAAVEEDVQRTSYIDLVKKAIGEIQLGTFQKVVVSRTLTLKSTPPPLALFQALVDTYENAFCYLWYHPKVGMWLGATPEILLRASGKNLTTMSLAGTQPFVEGKDPVWEAKEMEEQALVTDYISNTLKNNVHDLKQSNTTTVRAGSLWHLRTEISGTMKNNGLQDIIGGLHPTPAVCGVPMVAAKTFVLENENYPREYYTGFLGELNMDPNHFKISGKETQEKETTTAPLTELFVNLRCVQMKKDKVVIYVGGGITLDSVPAKEWQETVAKSKTILRVL